MEQLNNINIYIYKYNKNNDLPIFYIVPTAWNILEQMEHDFGTKQIKPSIVPSFNSAL